VLTSCRVRPVGNKKRIKTNVTAEKEDGHEAFVLADVAAIILDSASQASKTFAVRLGN
jgi:hypothetical protein